MTCTVREVGDEATVVKGKATVVKEAILNKENCYLNFLCNSGSCQNITRTSIHILRAARMSFSISANCKLI